MEHRWYTRTPVTARAIVYHPHYGSGVGEVCDVSSGGAFIELSTGKCALNSPVTLLLPFEDHHGNDLLRIPAMVVRSDDAGVGVMFLEHDDRAARELRRWFEVSRATLGKIQTEERVAFFV